MSFVTVTCPYCGNTIEINTNRGATYCGYCGRKVELAEGSEAEPEAVVTGVDPAELPPTLENRIAPSSLAIAVIFPVVIIIAIVLLGSAGFFMRIMPAREGYSVMPTSSDGFAGQLLSNVVETLEDAGFTNVKAVGEDEFYMLRLKGEVHSVEIRGVQVTGGQQYESDVEILVKYYE